MAVDPVSFTANEILKIGFSTGAAGTVVVWLAKWFINSYFEKNKELDKLRQQAIDNNIRSLGDSISDLKTQMSSMSQKLDKNERAFDLALQKIQTHSDEIIDLTKTLKAYDKRFDQLREFQTRLIELSKQAVMLKSTKGEKV